MKIRRIIINFEPYIIKEFGKRNLNLHLVNFKIFNNRSCFMREEWNIFRIDFKLLNFNININYEI